MKRAAWSVLILCCLLPACARGNAQGVGDDVGSMPIASLPGPQATVPPAPSNDVATSTPSTAPVAALIDPETMAGRRVGPFAEEEFVKCTAASASKAVGDPVALADYPNRPTLLQAAADPAAPLLVIFHGQHGCIENVQSRTDLETIGAAAGVSVLWLSGEPLPKRSWNVNGRCCEPASTNHTDDFAYTAAAIAAARTAGLSPRSVLSVGVSNGGGMALASGCKLPELFTAVISVAGWAPLPCQRHEMSLLTFGGTEDVTLGAKTATKIETMWRKDVVDCPAEPTIETFEVRTSSTWRGCTGGTTVRLVTLEGIPHTWPKFSFYDMDVDIIRFARGEYD
ncbi:unannotated protein [freshwater metagenome]|uniref:Unannotated protein n=1 Tax=freshwater metagenome TaxID=449393 RepID=A0A6J6ZP03_9ZZZZ